MPGLGQKLLQLLQALKIGRSIEIGITIVLIAVTLDRCSKAWAEKQPVHHEKGTPWWKEYRIALLWAAFTALSFALSAVWPLAHEIKRTQALTLSKEFDLIVDWLITFIDPITFAVRTFLIQWVLIPMRDAYLWLPFTAVLAVIAGVAWRIGGRQSAVVCLIYFGLIAMSGWWDRAMITAYMVSFSVFLATLLGMPLGIWASRNEKRATAVLLICDSAQTFPSFIYLIPVVMLFGVNDVAVICAVVVFGMVPITRYTIEGLRGVPGHIIEAADMSGASRRQKP